jgi:hypothetical protein
MIESSFDVATVTSDEQRACSLFFRLRDDHMPRISAEESLSLADNFVEQQQKQRRPHPDRPA